MLHASLHCLFPFVTLTTLVYICHSPLLLSHSPHLACVRSESLRLDPARRDQAECGFGVCQGRSQRVRTHLTLFLIVACISFLYYTLCVSFVVFDKYSLCFLFVFLLLFFCFLISSSFLCVRAAGYKSRAPTTRGSGGGSWWPTTASTIARSRKTKTHVSSSHWRACRCALHMKSFYTRIQST